MEGDGRIVAASQSDGANPQNTTAGVGTMMPKPLSDFRSPMRQNSGIEDRTIEVWRLHCRCFATAGNSNERSWANPVVNRFLGIRQLVVATVARRWLCCVFHALASVATQKRRCPTSINARMSLEKGNMQVPGGVRVKIAPSITDSPPGRPRASTVLC